MSNSIAPPAIETLKHATDGLLFPSETDAPLEPFFWPHDDDSKLTPETLAPLAGVAADTPVKSVKLETFFRPATKEEEWHNEEEKAEVKKFQALVEAIKETVKRPQVFRVGDTNIDVFIVGSVEGGYAGLQTKVVET